uniref:Peroxisomal membrane protein PEX14-like KPWE domain-containing protein n=1 Tax=Oryzias latipes TaxID=8090 RepID=A0A3P9HC32_ORYLA
HKKERNQSRGTCNDSQSRQLSFAEVMQLVQEGKEVPGVTKLDVHASNQSPTPSQMERRRKPWETSPADTSFKKKEKQQKEDGGHVRFFSRFSKLNPSH